MNRLELLRLFENVVREAGELNQSQTAKTLHAQLSNFGIFKGWDEKKWLKFGQAVKGLNMTPAVFTGALAAFIRWTFAGGKLPATTGHLSSTGLKTDRYAADKVAGILAGSEVLDVVEVKGSEILKRGYAMSAYDKKKIRANPNAKFEVWTLGDQAKELASVMHGLGLRLTG